MQYAELIAEKVNKLPSNRQAEILRYVEALAGEPANREAFFQDQISAILERAWGAWGTSSRESIDRTLANMREEWERGPSEFGLKP